MNNIIEESRCNTTAKKIRTAQSAETKATEIIKTSEEKKRNWGYVMLFAMFVVMVFMYYLFDNFGAPPTGEAPQSIMKSTIQIIAGLFTALAVIGIKNDPNNKYLIIPYFVFVGWILGLTTMQPQIEQVASVFPLSGSQNLIDGSPDASGIADWIIACFKLFLGLCIAGMAFAAESVVSYCLGEYRKSKRIADKNRVIRADARQFLAVVKEADESLVSYQDAKKQLESLVADKDKFLAGHLVQAVKNNIIDLKSRKQPRKDARMVTKDEGERLAGKERDLDIAIQEAEGLHGSIQKIIQFHQVNG